MCFDGPKWKREVIPDHKFDFVDVRDFHTTAFSIRMRYVWLYVLVIKSFLVYVSDIFTAVTMLSSQDWSNAIFNSCPPSQPKGCIFIPFVIARWMFVGCIIFSFLLLAYEGRKAKKIIASRDISYAFTNIMANNYYSLRSYDHFCFFCHINDSTKTSDNFAFFIFFTFKEWKRLLLADGPRQAINALTLYAIYLSKVDDGPWYQFSKYYSQNYTTAALLVSTTFTVVVFAGSLLLLITAAICYVPLLCYIRGNLKEYCCHKVDKRIAEVVKRKAKLRIQEQAAIAKKEAAGDYSHLKNSKGQMMAAPLPQPTLPNVSLEDDPEPPFWDKGNLDHKSNYEGSVYSGRNVPEYSNEYPPMPMYAGYPQYGQSQDGTLYDGSSAYEYENLAYNAAPPGQSNLPNPYSPQGHGHATTQRSGLSESTLAYDDAAYAYNSPGQPQDYAYESPRQGGYGSRR